MTRANLRKDARNLVAQMTGDNDHVVHAGFVQPQRMPLEQRAAPEFEQDLRRVRSQADSPARGANDCFQTGTSSRGAICFRKERPSA